MGWDWVGRRSRLFPGHVFTGMAGLWAFLSQATLPFALLRTRCTRRTALHAKLPGPTPRLQFLPINAIQRQTWVCSGCGSSFFGSPHIPAGSVAPYIPQATSIIFSLSEKISTVHCTYGYSILCIADSSGREKAPPPGGLAADLAPSCWRRRVTCCCNMSALLLACICVMPADISFKSCLTTVRARAPFRFNARNGDSSTSTLTVPGIHLRITRCLARYNTDI